jgi:hypothetical protein
VRSAHHRLGRDASAPYRDGVRADAVAAEQGTARGFGGAVKLLVSAAAVAAIAWFAAPWVEMARRGTADRCALEAMRREALVPLPRRPPDDVAAGRPGHDVPDWRDLPSAN